ncbi:VOC family protein [Streptomyces sp. NPDC048434]|uniref:VOC family protein n=1 Tax=Streptomyces sp. NPDC048434 TaxID=3365549 RepID=UPI0037171448
MSSGNAAISVAAAWSGATDNPVAASKSGHRLRPHDTAADRKDHPPSRCGFSPGDESGVGPRLYFQRVPEGKAVKNRLHLDVRVGTGLVGEERLAALEAECACLVPLGAVRVRLLYDGNDSCIVMQDIEGNEFCLD